MPECLPIWHEKCKPLLVCQRNAIRVYTCIYFIIFTLDLATAGDWDCVAAVERLPALHYSLDFIFLSFGIMGFIVEI